MLNQNIETHRQSQRATDPTLLAWAKRRETREQAWLVAYLYWFAQYLVVLYRDDGINVVMRWHPAYDLRPESMLVPPVDDERADRRFKRHLGRFSASDIWFTLEDGDVPVSTAIIPDEHRTLKDLVGATRRWRKLVELLSDARESRVIKPLDDYNEIIERRFPRRVRSIRDLVEAPPRMDRSDLIWKLACLCAEHNCTPSEIATVVAASQAYKSKHGKWNDRRLEPLVKKVIGYIAYKREKKDRKK